MKSYTEILKDLVGLPSFTGKNNPECELPMCRYLEHIFKSDFPNLKRHTFSVGSFRPGLIFLGSPSPKVLFACHTDTIPPSSGSQLKLKISGDQATGLGTKDMKGGIVSSLLCLQQVKNPSKIGILFYPDEEYSQKGMLKLVKILPGMLTSRPEIIVSPESRFNLGHGARGIIVVKLELIGKKSHSSRPHLGIDAIRGFYILHQRLETQFSQTSALGKTTFTLTHILGGAGSSTGKITDHTGTIPDIARATISIRNALTHLDSERLLGAIEKITHSLGLKISHLKILADHPARNTDPKLVKKIVALVKKETGISIKLGDPKLAGYNDAALLGTTLGSPVVNFGPYGEDNHTQKEWVSLKSIQETARVLSSISHI